MYNYKYIDTYIISMDTNCDSVGGMSGGAPAHQGDEKPAPCSPLVRCSFLALLQPTATSLSPPPVLGSDNALGN